MLSYHHLPQSSIMTDIEKVGQEDRDSIAKPPSIERASDEFASVAPVQADAK